MKTASNRLNSILQGIYNYFNLHKTAIARLFLLYYFLVAFSSIWLGYIDLKSVIEKLTNFQANKNTCSLINICGDTIITGWIKQHKFQITSFIEIGFLIIGVIVGNVGWDITGEIKLNGLKNIKNTYSKFYI